MRIARQRRLPASIVLLAILLNCWGAAADESGLRSVEAVYDGDTVRLAGGIIVRMIGINCPEVPHGDKAGEPKGEEARAVLGQLIGNAPVRVVSGRDDRDPYGRLLAYLYAGSTDLQLALITRGLASVVAIPPNTAHAEVYLRAEQAARAARVGMWGDSYFSFREPVAGDSAQGRRFVFLTGRIESVGKSRRYHYFRLNESTSVSVSQADWSEYFHGEPEAFIGRVVQVRGWISRTPTGNVVRIRHPAMWEVVAG